MRSVRGLSVHDERNMRIAGVVVRGLRQERIRQPAVTREIEVSDDRIQQVHAAAIETRDLDGRTQTNVQRLVETACGDQSLTEIVLRLEHRVKEALIGDIGVIAPRPEERTVLIVQRPALMPDPSEGTISTADPERNVPRPLMCQHLCRVILEAGKILLESDTGDQLFVVKELFRVVPGDCFARRGGVPDRTVG